MGKQVLGSFSPQVSCQSCGLAVGCEPENVECAEPCMGFGGKYRGEDVPREDAVVGVLKPHEESTFAGDEDSRLVIVPISQTEVEQPDFYITGEVMKMGTGAYTVFEGGGGGL
jgi:hypothetical protein